MTGYPESSQAVLYLPDRIKLVELRPHDGRLIWDITLRKSFKCRAVDTLAWTPPKFRQQRYHCYSWEVSDVSFAKNFTQTLISNHPPICDHLIVSLDEADHRDRLTDAISLIHIISIFLKITFILYFSLFTYSLNNVVDQIDFCDGFVPGGFGGLCWHVLIVTIRYQLPDTRYQSWDPRFLKSLSCLLPFFSSSYVS